MQNILDNKYVIGVLTILIFVYAASIRPELPPYIKVLFKNPIFKVFILFLIVVRGNKDPLFALAIAIAFVTTVTYLNQQQAKEAFENTEVNDESNDGSETFENNEINEESIDDSEKFENNEVTDESIDDSEKFENNEVTDESNDDSEKFDNSSTVEDIKEDSPVNTYYDNGEEVDPDSISKP
jgi:predicted membrane protein